jgi:AraC family transcriptional regulator of adaptative response/methylated-DNA-[protein]-cysteine methyltransferase
MEMTMIDYTQNCEDYALVEQAILYLGDHFKEQPELKEIADHVGLSEYHFQRLFTRWVGISPKRFLQYLTKEYALRLLARSESLLEVAYESGLSGPGRLHDLFVTYEAVTPGQVKSLGAGLTLTYGFHPTPFGECLLALTERGVCSLVFVQHRERQAALEELHQRWRLARWVEDPDATRPYVAQIFSLFRGQTIPPLQLDLRGTNFQLKVWEALLRIPAGSVVTYKELAIAIGMPEAARAVGNAVSSNPIPVLIPCHRVIRAQGEMGGYRWGVARKKALLGWEAAYAAGLD